MISTISVVTAGSPYNDSTWWLTLRLPHIVHFRPVTLYFATGSWYLLILLTYFFP